MLISQPPEYQTKFHPWPWLDALFDYVGLVAGEDGIARLDPSSYNQEVAIIGAGAAGLVAAFELLRAGLKPVIFEASGRVGGRLWSQHFRNADGSPASAFAELGAMRFPASGKLLRHYVDLLGLSTAQLFPNPGTVPTLLSYFGEKCWWMPGESVPEPYRSISATWQSYLEILLQPLQVLWEQGDIGQLRTVWQRYLHRFKRMNFGEVLYQVLPWTDSQLSRFGALGIGTGGFDVFFPLAFTEFLRLLANECEGEQYTITDGTQAFAHRLMDRSVTTPLGIRSLKDHAEIHISTPIRKIAFDRSRRGVQLYYSNEESPRFFKSVVAAIPLGCLQRLGQASDEAFLEKTEQEALQALHTTSSSKLFIRTKDKFWKTSLLGGRPFPHVILTEQAPRATYFLDYPSTENGVVCVSYTWEDDSIKWASLTAQEQYSAFRKSLVQILPELDCFLHPLEDEVIRVVWQEERWAMGAFKLTSPGHEEFSRRLFFQFQSALNGQVDRGIYLAGDGVSWSGGWLEGALQTGLNAAAAVLHRCGAQQKATSPLQITSTQFQY